MNTPKATTPKTPGQKIQAERAAQAAAQADPNNRNGRTGGTVTETPKPATPARSAAVKKADAAQPAPKPTRTPKTRTAGTKAAQAAATARNAASKLTDTEKPVPAASTGGKPAKPAAKPPMPGNIGAKTPPAPPAAVNLAELSATMLSVLYLAATNGPVLSTDGPPTQATTLESLRKRGLAELAPSGETTVKAYTVSAAGATLVALLWPDAKPATKRSGRKPAAK